MKIIDPGILGKATPWASQSSWGWAFCQIKDISHCHSKDVKSGPRPRKPEITERTANRPGLTRRPSELGVRSATFRRRMWLQLPWGPPWKTRHLLAFRQTGPNSFAVLVSSATSEPTEILQHNLARADRGSWRVVEICWDGEVPQLCQLCST